MTEAIIRQVVVSNPHGIHARPSHAIVTLTQQFRAEVRLVYDGRVANARSILSVMTLGAAQGAEVRIEAEGADADQVAEALAELIAGDLGEGKTEAGS